MVDLDVTVIGVIVGIAVGISGLIIGLIFEIIKLRREIQKEKFPINLTMRESIVQSPIVSNKAIEVRPAKIVADCSVRYNGKWLICDDNGNYVKYIFEGGTGLYRIPAGKEKDENAEVVVLDDKKVLLRTRLKDIHG